MRKNNNDSLTTHFAKSTHLPAQTLIFDLHICQTRDWLTSGLHKITILTNNELIVMSERREFFVLRFWVLEMKSGSFISRRADTKFTIFFFSFLAEGFNTYSYFYAHKL